MQQAARVSDNTAFFYLGDLIESGPTKQIFTSPKITEQRITLQEDLVDFIRIFSEVEFDVNR